MATSLVGLDRDFVLSGSRLVRLRELNSLLLYDFEAIVHVTVGCLKHRITNFLSLALITILILLLGRFVSFVAERCLISRLIIQ